MKLTIEGTTDEIQKALQAIGSGEEHEETIHTFIKQTLNDEVLSSNPAMVAAIAKLAIATSCPVEHI